MKKDAKAEQNIFSTPNLIDAYLIPQFKKDILNYGGSNPIRRIEKEPELTKQKITTLKQMYRDAKLLENKKNIISSSGFIQLKKSINIDAMTESIENIEATYVSSFSKYFWTKQRKQKFADALKSTYAESAGLQLSDEIYESVLKNAFIN